MISIIIPLFNRASVIPETLDSILSQSYNDWECIIVDDGSTDNSKQIVSSYVHKDVRFKYYSRPSHKPKGANACRNYGLEKSIGDYIVFYDSDDVMLPEKLQWHLDGFTNFTTIDGFILNSYYHNFKTCNSYAPWREKLFTLNLLEDYIKQIAGWQTGDVLWKRTSLNDINFNETLQSSQDFEFYAKALIRDKKFEFHDIKASLIRHTPGSIKMGKNNNTVFSNLMSREIISKELFHKSLINKELAQILLKDHYENIEILAYRGALKSLYSPLRSTYRLAAYLKNRKIFFKKIFLSYPLKAIKKIFF